MRTMLFTHMGNKCFRTRDVSFGKGFKDRIGLLPEPMTKEASPWKRVKTISELEYGLIQACTRRPVTCRGSGTTRRTPSDLRASVSIPGYGRDRTRNEAPRVWKILNNRIFSEDLAKKVAGLKGFEPLAVRLRVERST